MYFIFCVCRPKKNNSLIILPDIHRTKKRRYINNNTETEHDCETYTHNITVLRATTRWYQNEKGVDLMISKWAMNSCCYSQPSKKASSLAQQFNVSEVRSLQLSSLLSLLLFLCLWLRMRIFYEKKIRIILSIQSQTHTPTHTVCRNRAFLFSMGPAKE